MVNDWLTELLYGIGNFFLNPLLYWAVLLTLFVSNRRIRKSGTTLVRRYLVSAKSGQAHGFCRLFSDFYLPL